MCVASLPYHGRRECKQQWISMHVQYVRIYLVYRRQNMDLLHCAINNSHKMSNLIQLPQPDAKPFVRQSTGCTGYMIQAPVYAHVQVGIRAAHMLKQTQCECYANRHNPLEWCVFTLTQRVPMTVC